jgi:hypothetical protein
MAVNPFASIDELGAMLRAKEISSVELTRFYLERLERYGEDLGAVVTITRERAMREAEQADRDIASGNVQNRPLLGIPYGVKDLLATKGIPTTWGAEPFRNQVFDYDATVVQKIGEAGGVLVAKLAMVELAGGFQLQQRRRVVHRSGTIAVESRVLVRRIIERSGRGGWCGARSVGDRKRDVRIDSDAVRILRRDRTAPDIRCRVAIWRDGLFVDARQARPDVPQRVRLQYGPAHHHG